MKKFCVIGGVGVSKEWKSAEGCKTPSKLSKFTSKDQNTIVTVEDDKVKLYQKDENGLWRCLVWQLVTPDPELEAIKMLEDSFFSQIPKEEKPIINWQPMPVAA